MSVKKLIIIISGIALMLPFILVRDVYPFYRFGMFAKGVKHFQVLERFHVTTISREDSSEKVFYAYPSQAIIRQHLYRKEGRQLLEKFHESLQTRPEQQKDILSWQLYIIRIKKEDPDAVDTVLTEQLFADEL